MPFIMRIATVPVADLAAICYCKNMKSALTYPAKWQHGQVRFEKQPNVCEDADVLVVFLPSVSGDVPNPKQRTVTDAIREAQQAYTLPGRSLADELIRERRDEAQSDAG